MKFSIGDLVHNKLSHHDGRVREVQPGGYLVEVPLGCYSWVLGVKTSFWPEPEVEASNNQLLDGFA